MQAVIYARVSTDGQEENFSTAQQIRTLECERARIEQAHQKMIAAYQADAIGLDDLKASRERTHHELERIQRELARLDAPRKAGITAEEERQTIALVERMHAALGNLTDEDRLQAIEALDVRARVLLVERKRVQLDITTILGEYTTTLDSGALSIVDKTVQSSTHDWQNILTTLESLRGMLAA